MIYAICIVVFYHFYHKEDPAKLPLGSIYHFPESYLATPYTLCVPNGAAYADVTAVPPADVAFSSTEYIRTAAGNKVCLRSILCRSRKIHMAGKVFRCSQHCFGISDQK